MPELTQLAFESTGYLFMRRTVERKIRLHPESRFGLASLYQTRLPPKLELGLARLYCRPQSLRLSQIGGRFNKT